MSHDFRRLIREDYKEYLRLHKHELPDGLYESLKTHERVPKYFDNVARELRAIEENLPGITRLQIKDLTYSLTQWFIYCVKERRDQDVMSSAARQGYLENPENRSLNSINEELKEGGIIEATDNRGMPQDS